MKESVRGDYNFAMIFGFEGVYHFLGAGDDTAKTSEVLHGRASVHREAYIFNHLSGVELDNEHAFLYPARPC